MMERLKKDLRGRCCRKITIHLLVCSLMINTSVSTVLALEAGHVDASTGAAFTAWGDHTIIDTQNGAIIDWNNFNTAGGQSVTFSQSLGGVPSAMSAVLNRITSATATQFDGALNANGCVFVVNPAGIIFGAGSTVNVSQLVASGLNITDSDFINGIYQFSGGNGAVFNYGDISAQKVDLIGKQVLNAGTITSPDGYVIMAAGDRVLLGQPGSDIVVEIDSVTLPEQGQTEGIGDVINEGTVEAAGGTIVLAAGDTFSRAVDGLDSLSVAIEGGAGRIGQFGTLNADSADGDGGSITLTGGDVVALGGDSLTTANAGANGDGGEVIAYSPGTSLFRDGARIEAKGGNESGNGGFAEVSGMEHVEVFGLVDASATNGQSGTFLIDPTDITIQDGVGDVDGTGPNFIPGGNTSTISDDKIESYLDAGTNVVINTASAGAGSGDITQNADAQINKTTDNGAVTLTLKADRDIALNGGIASAAGSGTLNVDMTAGRDISVNAGANIVLNSSLKMTANNDIDMDADITLNSGLAEMYSGRTETGSASHLTVTGNIEAGSIKLEAGDPAGGFFSIHNLNVTGKLESTVGDVTVSAREHVTLGDVTAEGRIYATADNDNMGLGNLSTEGSMSAKGDIELKGRTVDVKAAANAGGNLTIRAMEDSGAGGGTMHLHAAGSLQADGNLDISIRKSLTDDTIYSLGKITLDGDAVAGGHLSLNNNTDMTTAGAKLEAGQDVILSDGKTLKSDFDLTVKADRHITLGGAVTADGKMTLITSNGGNVTTRSLSITDGQGRAEINVNASGDLTVNGDVKVGSNSPIDNVPLGQDAEAIIALSAGGNVVLNGDVAADAVATVPAADGGVTRADVQIRGGADVTINGALVATAVSSDNATAYASIEVEATDSVIFGPLASDPVADGDNGQVRVVSRTTEVVTLDGDVARIIIDQGMLQALPDFDETHMGSPFAGNVLANDNNPGGGPITAALVSGSGPDHAASFTLNPDGSYSYTPEAGYVGDDTFTYTATVGGDTTAPVLVTITMTNTLPVLNNDAATTNESTNVGGNVLTNDFDADGDPLTASLIDGPTNAGSFTLNPDGSFNYRPADGFIGEDSFTYSASDPEVGDMLGKATVTITVNEFRTTAPPAAPGVDVRVEPEISGYPALVKWVAEELGVDERLTDVRFANTLASAQDIPPYDAYSSFKKAANVLRDRRGTHTDALAQVISEFASSAAPPTEEQMASIAEAIAHNTETGNVYALAGSYLDSLAEYVAFLVHEVDFSEEDAVEFVMTKYVDQLAEKENVGLAAYVAARLVNLYKDSID